MSGLLESQIPGVPVRRGKVRDVYDFGERLLIVATDRISAFDWVLPTGIPDKGRVLTELTHYWFYHINVPNHLISTNARDVDLPRGVNLGSLLGRSMVVDKAEVFPVECVVRGYLSGSGWKEYKNDGTVCGIQLPRGLQESDKLPEPIFTPATKEESGHDINISFERMVEIVGGQRASELRQRSLYIYQEGARHALSKGIIVADTKFEFGLRNGQVILIDEVLTPDSSRFWPEDLYQAGGPQPSFDKQFVRDWLEQSGWDKNSPPPPLPDDVVRQTQEKYIQAYVRLTGRAWREY